MKAVRFCAAAAALVSGLVFVSCKSDSPTGPTLNGNVYENKTLGFNVTAPAIFQKLTKDTTIGGQNCILYGKDTTTGVPNFNILTMANNSVTDARIMLLGNSTFLAAALDNFAVADSVDTLTIDGKTCAVMTYTWTTEQTIQGATVDVPMRNKMIYMIHNGIDFILTFVDAQQGFQYHDSSFDEMVGTINFY